MCIYQRSDPDARAVTFTVVHTHTHTHRSPNTPETIAPQSIDAANCEAERTGTAPRSHPAIFADMDRKMPMKMLKKILTIVTPLS